MKDNFDLKKFLKENKTIENSNKYLANSTTEDDKKDALRSKVREMILKEIEGMDYPTMGEDLYEVKEDEDEIKNDESEDEIKNDESEDASKTEEEVKVVDDSEFDETEDTEEGGGDDRDTIENHLDDAMENAIELGDEEFMNQLGNTITYYGKIKLKSQKNKAEKSNSDLD